MKNLPVTDNRTCPLLYLHLRSKLSSVSHAPQLIQLKIQTKREEVFFKARIVGAQTDKRTDCPTKQTLYILFYFKN